MSDTTKPREGYIPKFSLVPIDSPLANGVDREAVYHVIEFSAYAAMRAAKASRDLFCDQIEKELGREIRDLRVQNEKLKTEFALFRKHSNNSEDKYMKESRDLRSQNEKMVDAMRRLLDWATVANHKLIDADNWPGGLAIKLAEEALAPNQDKDYK